MSTQTRTVATFPKNSREEIRLSLSEFKGELRADLRTWYDPRERGERKPSREGVSLRIEHIPALIEALQEAGKLAGGNG